MTTTGETTQSTLGRIRTVADLDNLKGQGLKSLHPTRPKISVGMATCGLATGAGEVFERFCHEVESRGLDVLVTRTACIGFCQMEPIVAVELPGKGALALKQVKPAHVQRILEKIAAGELPRDGAL